MKKILKCEIIAICLAFFCSSQSYSAYALKKTVKPSSGSTEELYQDIFVSQLDPYIQKAIDDYYKEYFKDLPGYAPYMVDVLSVERPNGYRTFEFIVTLQVTPFLGPHVTVGIDNLTFRIGAGSEVKLEKYEHIKSFELPSNYKNEIKNKLP